MTHTEQFGPFGVTFDDTPLNGLNTIYVERGGAQRIYHVGGYRLSDDAKRRIRADGVRVVSEAVSNERGAEIHAMMQAGKQPVKVRDFDGYNVFQGKRYRNCIGWHVEELHGVEAAGNDTDAAEFSRKGDA